MKLSKERLEEIQLAITLWKESGLSQGEFSRQENIYRALNSPKKNTVFSFNRFGVNFAPSFCL
jgi:hypothetical protein